MTEKASNAGLLDLYYALLAHDEPRAVYGAIGQSLAPGFSDEAWGAFLRSAPRSKNIEDYRNVHPFDAGSNRPAPDLLLPEDDDVLARSLAGSLPPLESWLPGYILPRDNRKKK